MKTWVGISIAAVIGILILPLSARLGLDIAKVFLELLAGIRVNVQSPVRVVGGSIHIFAYKGWTRTYTPPGEKCDDPALSPVNHCRYTSDVDTTKLYFENVTVIKDGKSYSYDFLPISVTGPWAINVWASNEDGTKGANGVTLCTSSKAGNCDTSSSTQPSGYLTAAPLGSDKDGFYPESDVPEDRKYHHANVANCKYGYYGRCENMHTITLTMSGSSVGYKCTDKLGLECVVGVGQ